MSVTVSSRIWSRLSETRLLKLKLTGTRSLAPPFKQWQLPGSLPTLSVKSMTSQTLWRKSTTNSIWTQKARKSQLPQRKTHTSSTRACTSTRTRTYQASISTTLLWKTLRKKDFQNRQQSAWLLARPRSTKTSEGYPLPVSLTRVSYRIKITIPIG